MCEGNTLKNPNLDLEAMASASAAYFSLIFSILLIILKMEYTLVYFNVKKIVRYSIIKSFFFLFAHKILIECNSSFDLEDSSALIISVNGMQLDLPSNRTSTTTVGFSIGI